MDFNTTQQPSELSQALPKLNRKRKRTSKATSSQIETLISKLEAQSWLVTRRFHGLQGRENFDSGWREIANDLNSLPNGSIKTPDQWIKVWRDFKCKACARAAKLKKTISATGNQPINDLPLNEIEKRIISLIGADYTFGTNCPDSMPEEDLVQCELEAGVVEISPIDLPITDNIQIEVMDSCDLPPEVPLHTQQITTPENITVDTRTPIECEQVHFRKRRNLNPRRSTRDELNSAKAEFAAIAKTNAESMRILANAAEQQAEAAKMHAEAAQTQAVATKVQAEALLILAQGVNKIGDYLASLQKK